MTLIDIVGQCDQKLYELENNLSILPLHIPAKVKGLWQSQVKFRNYLNKSASLLIAREAAWKTVKNMADDTKRSARLAKNQADHDPQKPETLNKWTFNGLEIDFSVARYLALVSYTTTTWAIYDNLFNVVGRIAAIPELSRDPRRNPKLQALYDLKNSSLSEFNGEENQSDKSKKIYLFQQVVHEYAIEQYAWSCAFSYEIRNWLVHEGMKKGDLSLFKGDEILDGLILSPDTKQHIEKTITSRFKENHRDIARFDSIWTQDNAVPDIDLAIIFEYCHSEIDSLFISLLPWAVGSLENQVVHFGTT